MCSKLPHGCNAVGEGKDVCHFYNVFNSKRSSANPLHFDYVFDGSLSEAHFWHSNSALKLWLADKDQDYWAKINSKMRPVCYINKTKSNL